MRGCGPACAKPSRRSCRLCRRAWGGAHGPRPGRHSQGGQAARCADGATPPASSARLIAHSQDAVAALYACVARHTPPPGYRRPEEWDEARARHIVSYAHKLSYTSFAPRGFVLGRTSLNLHKPPAPQEFQLRSSQLHQLQRVCGGHLTRFHHPPSLGATPPAARAVQFSLIQRCPGSMLYRRVGGAICGGGQGKADSRGGQARGRCGGGRAGRGAPGGAPAPNRRR